MLIAHYLNSRGHDVTYVDPLTGDDNQPEGPCVILLAHSASTTYKYMQEEGDDTDKLYCEIPQGSVVVDPWRKFIGEDGIEVNHYGNSRKV